MQVREPRSVAEYRAGERVLAAAWEAAFDDIVTAEAIRQVHESIAGAELAERYRRLERSEDAVALIARTSDGVVGTASAAWADDRTKGFVRDDDAELVTLYTDPEHWGEGIGTALVAGIVDRLPPVPERLVLETFADNEIGRRFYESQGFEETGTWRFEIAGETYPTVVYARSV